MSYYKSSIGATPFFTTNSALRIEHYDCELVKKRLKSLDIAAVVKKIPYGCSIVSDSSYLKVMRGVVENGCCSDT